MIGILLSLYTLLNSFWDCVLYILQFFGKYIPAYLALIASVLGVIEEYIPIELSAVLGLCVSVMVIRFVYNAVRGSGA